MFGRYYAIIHLMKFMTVSLQVSLARLKRLCMTMLQPELGIQRSCGGEVTAHWA